MRKIKIFFWSYILIAFLSFLLQGCSITLPRISAHQKGINPEFRPYIEEYLYLVGQKYRYKIKKLNMNFTNLPGRVIGRCWWLLNTEYEIEIDKKNWDQTDFISRQFTVYHELEHCVRHRMHTNRKDHIENFPDFFEEVIYILGFLDKPGYLKDRCPYSVMHSEEIPYGCAVEHYFYYLEEIKKFK